MAIRRKIAVIIGLVGGAVGLALGVATMVGAVPSVSEQVSLLSVGLFGMGVALISVVSLISQQHEKR